MPGLRKFDAYVYSSTPFTFSGQRLYEILDSFASALQMHLVDEIVWILSLNKYEGLDLAAIDVQHGLYVKAHSSKLRLLPYFLTNHDLTYEGGIHSWWPTGNRLRDFFLRYFCTQWHRGAWKYSACSLAGKPRRLQGIKWDKLGEVTVETAMVEMSSQEPVNGPPQRPDKAHTKEDSNVSRNLSVSRLSSTSTVTPRSSLNMLVR